jgi:hypothetical protein
VCQFISTCRSVIVNASLMSLCSRLVNMYVKCDSMVRMFQKCFKRWLHEMWHIWRTSQGYFGGKEALAHLKWMCQGVAVITNGMYVCLLSACSNLG